MTNQTRWHTDDPKIKVWRRLGAVCSGSWSPAGPKAHPDAFQDTTCIVFWYFVGCLFVIAPRTVCARFLCHFEHIFDCICGVVWSKVQVTLLATFLRKTMIFKVIGPQFSLFFEIFSGFHSGLQFYSFFVILWSPRLPFWSLWA